MKDLIKNSIIFFSFIYLLGACAQKDPISGKPIFIEPNPNIINKGGY
jgi:hypothetical protein